MKKPRILEKLFTLFLVISICTFNYAAIVSDNDGSAFVAKAEFDALKRSFNKQIDDYNKSIDGKIDGAIAAYLSGIQLTKTSVIDNAWGEKKYCTIVEKNTITDITPTKFDLNWNCTAVSIPEGLTYGFTYATATISRETGSNIEMFLIKKVGTSLWNFDQYTKEATITLKHSGVGSVRAGWSAYGALTSDTWTWRSIYQTGSTTAMWDKTYGETGGPSDGAYVWNNVWGMIDAVKFSDQNLNWRYLYRNKDDYANRSDAGVLTYNYDNEYQKKDVDSSKTSSYMIISPEQHTGDISWVVEEPASGNKFANSRFKACQPPSCFDQTISKWGFADPGKAGVNVTGAIGGYGNGFGGSVKVRNIQANSWYSRSTSITSWETNGSSGNIWWEWWYTPDTVDITKIKNVMGKLKTEDRKSGDDSLCAGVLVLHNVANKYKTCSFQIDTSNLSKKFKIGLSQEVFSTSNSESNRDAANNLNFMIEGNNYVGWSDLQNPGIIDIKVDCRNNEFIYLTLKYDTSGSTCKHEIFSIEKDMIVESD